jgi:hypothetical protein
MSLSHSDPTINCDFPNTATIGYWITSCRSSFYNCIAWAAGETNAKWWPIQHKVPGWYWPPGIRNDVTVASFIEMFGKEGDYEEWSPENGDLEDGYEKVAIYVDKHGTPTHAARQLVDGTWTSKIGQNKDVIHATLDVWESTHHVESAYGKVAKFLRRKRQESPVPPACRLNPRPPCKPVI